MKGVLIKSPPRNSPQRIDYSCSGGFFFAKKLPAGARTPEPMCSKMPIMTSLGFREFINVPDVPQNFARLAIRRSSLSRKKTRGVVSSSTDDFINTPLFSKGAGFYQTALEMVILGIAFIEIPRGNPRLQTREKSRSSFLSSVKNVFRFSRSESFLYEIPAEIFVPSRRRTAAHGSGSCGCVGRGEVPSDPRASPSRSAAVRPRKPTTLPWRSLRSGRRACSPHPHPR